jgi:hypothetical protein
MDKGHLLLRIVVTQPYPRMPKVTTVVPITFHWMWLALLVKEMEFKSSYTHVNVWAGSKAGMTKKVIMRQ